MVEGHFIAGAMRSISDLKSELVPLLTFPGPDCVHFQDCRIQLKGKPRQHGVKTVLLSTVQKKKKKNLLCNDFR